MKNNSSYTQLLNDSLGAFADGAILFPILAALTLTSGFSGFILLVSAGIAYIVSGLLFRVPISVQPLKSIAIAALAVGASTTEVCVSGFLLGLFCLFLSTFNVNALSKKIPIAIVHGVQAGLGILLMIQGIKYAWGSHSEWFKLGIALFACLLMCFIPRFSRMPLLGLVATGGLVFAVVSSQPLETEMVTNPVSLFSQFSPSVRWSLILSLVLPQIALTLANSVLGTKDVCQRYFGDQAKLVTEKRLLISIGIGNILSALIAGVPFCHGAGGVTAHYQGGARTYRANLIVGGTLLVLALLQSFGSGGLIQFSPLLMGVLLLTTGLFHLRLAQPTWQTADGKIALIIMGSIAAITQNMLLVLMVGVTLVWFKSLVPHTK